MRFRGQIPEAPPLNPFANHITFWRDGLTCSYPRRESQVKARGR
jgi:hypothetical protein